MTERDTCLVCGEWLDMSELEVGSGCCHPCGHARYAAQLASARPAAKEINDECPIRSWIEGEDPPLDDSCDYVREVPEGWWERLCGVLGIED